MNSNAFQSLLTVVALVLAAATSILLSLGCTADAAGAISCAASTAPTWLAPYLGIAATVIGVVKMIIAAFQGKVTAPTAVVSDSGKPGTVAPSAVVKQ